MIIDVTGIELTPGKFGEKCLGNGEHYDSFGNPIECCCNECDYYMCCFGMHTRKECKTCTDQDCPRANKVSLLKKLKSALKFLCC